MGQHEHEQAAHEAAHAHASTRVSSDPTVTLLATVHEPADLAAVLRQHADQQAAILRLAHARFGNGFVAEAMPLVPLSDAQARTAAPAQLATPALRGVTGDRPSDMISADADTHQYDARARLPFTTAGWDATAILTHLGQRDSMAETDSDGKRCVQAVAIASHVVRGPGAVVALIQHVLGDPAHGSRTPTARQTSARAVLARVADRVRDRAATFQDLSWAQEAMHDLTNPDGRGTSGPDTLAEVAPSATTTAQVIGRWCNTPQEVMQTASGLRDGEQLMMTAWDIHWNAAIIDWNLEHPNQEAHHVDVTREDGSHRRRVQELPIRNNQRPDPARAVSGRDSMNGHQLLVVREHGELRIYEPESRAAGHYSVLDAAALGRYFAADPAESNWHYIKLDARLTPR